jgi:drug/metabolite transporter (DMT)-like permease
VAVLCVVVGVVRPATVGMRTTAGALALASGVLDMSANVFYLEATRRGLLSVVAVISAMYPVSTVALAFGTDRERVTRAQAVGMALAAGALALVGIAGA